LRIKKQNDMQQNPTAAILFFIITIVTTFLFYKASNRSKTFLIIVIAWMIIQSVISINGFYINEFTKPPRFSLLVFPPVIFIIVLFSTHKGRLFIDKLNLQYLTILQSIRIVVEIILYMLFISDMIPKIMTFEGRNFDVLAGLTAPVVYYFVFNKTFSKKILIAWNILSLGLLLNIIYIAVSSLQTPFQQLAFEQPNTALTYFPFTLLPSIIVPIVLFSHLASLKQLFSYAKKLSVNYV
jgi:hypothetical protein